MLIISVLRLAALFVVHIIYVSFSGAVQMHKICARPSQECFMMTLLLLR